MTRFVVAVASLASVIVAMAGCTSGAPRTPTPSTEYSTTTVTVAPPSSAPVSPIRSGPTTVVTARSCPFLEEQTAADRVGFRLDAIKVLSSGGKAIGCRFYPLGHPNAQCDATCLREEHVPPTSQPAIEITSASYVSAADAHTAVVSLGRAGTNPQQTQIASGVTGLCYQSEFYPKDRGKDWTCAFSKGTVAVVVRTATTDSYSAGKVAEAVAAKL